MSRDEKKTSASISREVIEQARRLQILTGRRVNENFAGLYESAFKGRGLDFAELNEYQPGDDIRAIDWKVTARAGRPFVRSYIEERELSLLLMVDGSASAHFGSGATSKAERAAELCAVLAFTAMRNQDKVGLLLFTDHVERYIPPAKGSRHGLKLISELMSFRPRGAATDIAAGLDAAARILKKRAIVFLVSDFFAERYQRSMELLNQRHDLIAVVLRDPRELELPNAGLIALRDAETGAEALVDSGDHRVRERYRLHAEQRDRALERRLSRAGVDRIAIRTDRPSFRSLAGFFRGRERRRLR